MDRIRALREARGWSQRELAERAGISRPLLGAMERGDHVPGVAAALAVARALDTTVEALFAEAATGPSPVVGGPLGAGVPVDVGRVGTTIVVAPVAGGPEPAERWGVPDAVLTDHGADLFPDATERGLVVAGCDPLLGVLTDLVARRTGHGVLVVHASTAEAVEALAGGRVHAAVVHGPSARLPRPPCAVQRLDLARWRVGLASRGSGPGPDLGGLAERRAPVAQRRPGAAIQDALDRALRGLGATDALPGPVAGGHLDAARRAAHGAVTAGLTMEPAALAFDLGFAPLEEHVVELWIDERWAALPAVLALAEQTTEAVTRRRIAAIAGYDVEHLGRSRTPAGPRP